VSEKKRVIIGGDIDKTLKGEFDFDIKELLEQGWILTQTTKGVLCQSLLIILSVAIVMVYGLIAYVGAENVQNNTVELNSATRLFMEIISTTLTAPLLAGVIMMGINHSVGAVSKAEHLFQYVPQCLPIVLVSLMTGLLTQFGLVLYILPGFYIAIAMSFATPLVVEKKMTPLMAIYTSVRAVNKKALKFSLLYLIFLALLFVGLMTLGVAFIWIAPLYYNIKGILYRDMFGVTVTLTTDKKGDSSHESVFIA
jgi:hypothetical protein